MDNVGNAVDQLIQLIDEYNMDREIGYAYFKIDTMTISPDKNNEGGWIVRAYNANNKMYNIAMYVTYRGEIVADG